MLCKVKFVYFFSVVFVCARMTSRDTAAIIPKNDFSSCTENSLHENASHQVAVHCFNCSALDFAIGFFLTIHSRFSYDWAASHFKNVSFSILCLFTRLLNNCFSFVFTPRTRENSESDFQQFFPIPSKITRSTLCKSSATEKRVRLKKRGKKTKRRETYAMHSIRGSAKD